jgi:hypothetical protein
MTDDEATAILRELAAERRCIPGGARSLLLYKLGVRARALLGCPAPSDHLHNERTTVRPKEVHDDGR